MPRLALSVNAVVNNTVPPFNATLPAVAEPGDAPRLESPSMESVPPLILVPPVNVLAAVSTKVPSPALVNPAVPAQDVAGFLAWLRAKGDAANFATTGIGAASHLAAELLKQRAGVDFTLVTYRGTPQAVTDLLAGRADFMIDSQTLLAPLAQEGKLRALAVTTPRRSRLLPALPTLAEAGIAGYAASSWQALYAPTGTPAPILDRVAAAVAVAQADPAVQARYAEQGIELLQGGPAEATRFIYAEAAKWTALLKR